MEQIVNNKKFGLVRLIMINIIAVDSLRNISITAQAGWIVITFYILAAIFFLIPCALLTAEMSTGSSKETGGIYIWVRKAFGKKIGFLVIWLQWVYNLVWFPSICAFFAGIIGYIVAPLTGLDVDQLVTNPWYIISISLIMFWSATGINLFGIKTSSTVSTFGAFFGTLLPIFIIIIISIIWLMSHSSQIKLPTICDFIPSNNNIDNWALFITVMFSLFGLEMSAIHVLNVKNAKKNFPRALLISGSIILVSLILSNVAVILVSDMLEISNVNIVTGLIISFNYFFTQINMPWMTYVIAITLIFGSFTTTSTWIMGLSRAFMVVSNDSILPKIFGRTNKNNAPDIMLITQAIIFTIFCFAYIFMPSVNEAYWYLSDLTAQLAVIAYILMFITAVKLKMSLPIKKGQYEISKGYFGTIFMASLGCLGCLIAIIVGFIPKENISMSLLNFDVMLILGILITLSIPIIINIKK